ncbi:DegT/DnrJ/EryC1/StrS family aminotransferase [Micromonospora chaiyaphumensis]|uniref:dTDP-4-amino-4,6-dideoxygalactose transaminase n=1 Tax=Micromonospora chaiyaphumensis TaxID=307119 RepID=A0A1C4X6I8_9ACTN|nr:aminotransferase class I/II-fold pyridoxal phosphate-dependent enzyme [Micromonospora chaiyaphumensis]SCF04020.1 dTDP-4-amino-4,6-dideoxygalactose transaminase [Micromonospora chaiyaphumensis]
MAVGGQDDTQRPTGGGHERVLLSPPDVGPLEESYLLRALRSGWVAPVGPEVDAFERELAERVGTAHAVALSSGTAGLHLALIALGVRPGDAVIVPTLTFVATANAVVYTGAEPVFVDCEPESGNLDPELLDRALRELRHAGRRVAAVLPVDMFGSCADYGRILPICAAAGVPLVEDAAEALGATFDGRPAGSFGRAGVLSFNGNKIITTSGGGMLVTDDGDLADRCRYLSTQARQPVPHYEHTDTGYNYRLSNLLAAVGRAQLRRLDSMMARRRAHRSRYAALFAQTPGVRLLGAGDPAANCWLTSILVDPEAAGWRAGELAAHLAAADIETRPVWKPMHLQPVFAGARTLLTGAAERLFATGLTLPSGSGMTPEQVDRVCARIDDFLRRSSRGADPDLPAVRRAHVAESVGAPVPTS